MNDLVKLDVGGTKFKTTRATLMSSPNSLLARMFDPDSDLPPASVSEDGTYISPLKLKAESAIIPIRRILFP